MRLTPNFSLEEFTRSETAERHGIENELSSAALSNLHALAVGLEQVRSMLFNYPITIHSGYRHPHINKLVGGVPDSDHVLGYAADITVEEYTPLEACNAIANSPLVFDQLIHYPASGMLHISFNPRLRRQVLTKTPDGRFVEGIV